MRCLCDVEVCSLVTYIYPSYLARSVYSIHNVKHAGHCTQQPTVTMLTATDISLLWPTCCICDRSVTVKKYLCLTHSIKLESAEECNFKPHPVFVWEHSPLLMRLFSSSFLDSWRVASTKASMARKRPSKMQTTASAYAHRISQSPRLYFLASTPQTWRTSSSSQPPGYTRQAASMQAPVTESKRQYDVISH